MCALTQTKLNERGEVMFRNVVGWKGVWIWEREGTGKGNTVTEKVVAEVCNGMVGDVPLASVG